ncbi:MAG: patatin-like phospholipase family protein [Myxococcales bacterium]|nr:patatin-like phospholipase family protein [Myxococcales bacterium]
MAMVLSGGGARGAYEVGVLSYLYGEITKMRSGKVPRVDIISGTSVGAINGCYLAAHMADPVGGVKRLVDLWTGIQFERVFRFDLRQALRLPRMFTGGGGDASGIFDVQPMVELVTREISWKMMARSIRRGLLRAVSVSATEVATGRTTLFVDTAPEISPPTNLGPRTVVQREIVGPQHALASAAIPMIFPPVKIGTTLYCDGGLRQNTPIAPALRLGAEKILVVGLSREARGSEVIETPSVPRDRAPSAMFLLGKVLNAFLLDHVQTDVELLQRINLILDDVTAVGGPDFVQKLSARAFDRGAEPYRKVETLVVRPSQDIGRLAGQHVRRGRIAGSLLARQVLSFLESGDGDESDLASYLLFDGAFARKLIDLGRADAEAMRDKLLAFVEA